MGEWSNLTQREKSNIIRFAIKNGVSDINTIRDTFNVYAKDSLANVDYNMAAAKASGFGSNGNSHYPDTFKRPNHPTFSDESIYHSEATPGGRWRGNTYEPSGFVLNQQGGWNQFLRGFYNQEQGTGAVPVFNGGVMLPEVTVTPQYKEGGKIYIKPSKRGTFTAAATKHGKSVQEFARQVLANKENYSPAMVKKANFARNVAHWHEDGGPNIGGYSDRQLALNKQAAKQYDPTLGFDPISWGIYLFDPYNYAKGEENLFWNTYLGLAELPKAKPSAMWPGDPAIEKGKRLRGEEPSDFYSTTPRMDQMIQARLDTAGLKRVIDNYDDIQKKGLYKGIADRETLLSLYNEAKNVLNNPDSIFYLHGEDGVRLNPEQYQVMESFPLGMLGDFGVMWDRNHNQIKVEDAYNFPGWVRFFSGNPGIPKRPREMKIRANISLDPNKGSYLLRSDDNWNNLAPIMTVENTKSTGGPLYLYPFSFKKNPYLKTPIVRY